MTTRKLRTERTISLRNVPLSKSEQVTLAALFNDPRYDTLLDVFERACILQETALIRTPSHEEGQVLAEQKLSKAFWTVFEYVQMQVLAAHRAVLKDADDFQEVEPPTEEEEILGVN